jgi:hypothetical protein
MGHPTSATFPGWHATSFVLPADHDDRRRRRASVQVACMTQNGPERDLNSPAEPVSPAELNEGSIYFPVNFADEEMLIPMMATVVYIGENLEAGDENQVYFQDIDSFNRGVRYGGQGDGGHALFETGSRNELGHVFDFDRALDVLTACLLRRRKSLTR